MIKSCGRVWRFVGSAAGGVLLTALLGLLLAALSTTVMATYGWALFVGLPFALGLLPGLLYSARLPRTLRGSLGVGVAAPVLACVLAVGGGMEGAICIVMAMPIVLPMAAVGASLGHRLRGRRPEASALRSCAAVAVALPLWMGLEASADRQPAVRAVTTSVVVDAPPEVVWRHVVSFPPLPPPREPVFRLGIAYPRSATITGRGVGAVRRCRFSTGDFVEPITVWDRPRLLRFDVTSQPEPMRELSPWGAVHPPHLDGFLRSRRGQFRLVRLPGGRTRLEGTTWYENRMWPAAYWRLWSDELIHAIHRRVLEHVAGLAEARA